MSDREHFAKHFTALEHLAFAAPRMAMSLLVMSYLVVDGVLVARFVGMTGLSAVSMTFPITSAMMAVGVMIAAGCGAVAARRLGARNRAGALEAFSTALSSTFLGGGVLGGTVLAFLPDVCELIGMTQSQTALALDYQGVLLCATGFFLLNFVFQSFFTVAGRPKAGLVAAAAVGVLNIALDILFMGPMQLGIRGAALATVSAWVLGAVIGFWYFMRPDSPMRPAVRLPHLPTLVTACGNGLQEFIGNLAVVATVWVYNRTFMAHLGVDGVAALAVCTFAAYVFNACYHGFCEATGPIVGFKYGAKDFRDLRSFVIQSTILAALISVSAFVLAVLLGDSVLRFFSSDEGAALALARENFPVFSLSLLILCLNMLAGYFFSAVGDGRRAALIAFCRASGFSIAAVLLLPRWLGDLGLWLAGSAAEAATLLVAAVLLWFERRRWGFG